MCEEDGARRSSAAASLPPGGHGEKSERSTLRYSCISLHRSTHAAALTFIADYFETDTFPALDYPLLRAYIVREQHLSERLALQ